MNTLRVLYHLARADFLERVRRYSFFLTLAATAYLGYIFVPPLDAQYQTVTLGNARGIYNSPWIGAMLGLMISTMVSIVAFYLVNNAISRDRRTRVGEIIASTPVSKFLYVLGKWLSNLAVLALMLAVLTLVALVMQLLRAEDLRVDLLALATPIWLMGLPVMAVVAALAVLFESIPFLSGGFGNIVYFFACMTFFTITLQSMDAISQDVIIAKNDFYGMSRILNHMQTVIKTYDPDYAGSLSIGADIGFHDPLIFRWEGMRWTLGMILERLSWLLVAAGIATVAALPLNRFDPARRCLPRARKLRRRQRTGVATRAAESALASAPILSANALTPLADRKSRWRFLTVLRAEVRLMLRGQPWWWYLIAGLLIVLSTVTPPDTAMVMLAFAWLWPILIWSPLGAREARHFTHELVFSVPHPLRSQLAATWLAGVLVALLMTSGGLLLAFSSAATARAATMLAGALFVPSLALAMGVWSGTARLFEIVYLLLWYVAFDGIPALDFMGLSDEGTPYRWIYLGLTVLLLVAAVLGRQRQLQQ